MGESTPYIVPQPRLTETPQIMEVIDKMAEVGALIARGRMKHSYPHSWRSKAPLIFRNTPQWFISMGDEAGPEGLRATALKAIDATRFYPASGQKRLRGMIEQRPDWVISRLSSSGISSRTMLKQPASSRQRASSTNRRACSSPIQWSAGATSTNRVTTLAEAS